METIRFLISKILALVVVIIGIVFLYWLGTIIFPFIPKTLFKASGNGSTTGEFFLPSPRSLRDGFTQKMLPRAGDGPVYVDNNQYTGFDNQMPNTNDKNVVYISTYVTYDASGTQHVITRNPSSVQTPQMQTFDATRSGFSQTELYIRNLSIYRGGAVYSNLQFQGEARESMYVNGKFLLFLVNPQGQIVGLGEGYATEQWTVPGWHRFSAKITTQVTYNGPACTLVFQQAKANPTRVGIPVTCAAR